MPPGIAFGNGRIEAQEIDIDTKFAGRVSEILADAGLAAFRPTGDVRMFRS